MGLSKSKRELKDQAMNRQELNLIDSDGISHRLKLKAGKTLLEIAVDNSVELPHSCGGMGSCGTCRIRLEVRSGPCPPRGDLEAEMALERGYRDDERLSCQIDIHIESFTWTAVSLATDQD
jgi:ferredoxin